jgi:hypothetical protein
MESMLQPDPDVPPIEPEFLSVEEPRTKWPTVIGVISLCYAILGMMCGVVYGLSTTFSEFFMRMAGMQVTIPAALKITAVVAGLIMLALGIMMTTGAVRLLRRKRSGVATLKNWAILRVIFVVVSVVANVLLAPSAVMFATSMEEAQIKMLEENGQAGAMQPKGDQYHWRMHMINTAIGAGIMSIYPVFLGLYLSRRRIADEVATWR